MIQFFIRFAMKLIAALNLDEKIANNVQTIKRFCGFYVMKKYLYALNLLWMGSNKVVR